MSGLPVVSLLIWLPIAGAVACLLVPEPAGDGASPPAGARGAAPWVALAVMLVTLAIAAAMLAGFPAGAAGLQFEEHRRWIPQLGISYHLGWTASTSCWSR
jgi:NADH-quinone oxidoreductase subunit M